MAETPDYVYQSWIKDAFEKSSVAKSGKTQVELLEDIRDLMAENNELLKRLLGARPSPS